ncbi:MAG: hypothetical protein GVY06_11565 [Alphaproteobacteria bacterium]|nr:hypothetical protein [Alphaproteobacteria bacterium]
MKISTFSPIPMPVGLPEPADTQVNENSWPEFSAPARKADANSPASTPARLRLLQRRNLRQARREIR